MLTKLYISKDLGDNFFIELVIVNNRHYMHSVWLFIFLAEDNRMPMDKIFFRTAVYLVLGDNYRVDGEVDPKVIPGKPFRVCGDLNVKMMWSCNMVGVEITPGSGNL